MNALKKLLLLISVTWPIVTPAKNSQIASSGPSRVSLLELYSSESCSSCPPADQWISALKNNSGLWRSFVPVVFHVDYWNHLNWKDGFSSEAMTKRQVDLSRTWKKPLVYTPALVLDGQEWRTWRSQPAPPISPHAGGISLSLQQIEANQYSVKAEGLSPGKNYVVRLATLGMDEKTNVTAGENAGRKLEHNFVVLAWETRALTGGATEVKFSPPPSAGKRAPGAVAAWIESESSPAPLQAVGGYLPR